MKLLTILMLISLACHGQSPFDQGKAFFEAKKYDDAKKSLKSIKSDGKLYAQAQYYLGRIAFIEKDLDAAEDYLEEAIDTDDKVADYHYWLGSIFGTAAGQANVFRQGMLAPRIKEEFEKAVALKEDYIEAHWGLIEFHLSAPGIVGGSVDQALVEANTIGKYNEAEGHRARAMVYIKQEKYNDAENEYLLLIKTNPTSIPVIINFYVGRKSYDKAFTLLENFLKSDPQNFLIIYQMGKTSAISGQQLDRGLECLTKYLGYQPKPNEPSTAGAHMRMGQILEKRASKVEAKKHYEIAVKLDPNLKDAKEGLKRVSN